MTRGRRRLTRNNMQQSQEESPLSTRASTPAASDHEPSQNNKDACPACVIDSAQTHPTFGKESWILCDLCKTWYHWRCAGNGGEVEAVDKWYCKACLDADHTLSITLKAPARKSFRKRTQRDYANLNAGLESDPKRWIRMLEKKTIKDAPFKRLEGGDVSLEWLKEDGNFMTEPVVIERPDGLGMKMPPGDFTVDNVTELMGENTPVEVIDVATQSTSPGWTLGKWNEYFKQEPAAREKICNVISLEVSCTKLSDMILPPRLVRELDWVENYWPSTRKGKGHIYPKVQLYCLMGVADAWTDWHIDFAGSSVYYHIVRGSKVFYFIRPTIENLAAYERWSGTELQNHSWLGDMVDEVVKVELLQGNTMIIPTGWIHAVYTPVDTLVFGGNFLHSYNVATQLRVRNIEIATQVPKKFRFPMFSKLCWYVGDKVLRDLKMSAGATMTPRVLESMLALAEFLVTEARALEGGGEGVKKEVRDQIPSDRIKDAPAMARELRWRLRVAMGYPSDDEASRIQKSLNENKRKRVSPTSRERSEIFKYYKPKVWDSVMEKNTENELKVEKRRRPDDEESWVTKWMDETSDEDVGKSDAQVRRRREVIVKMRRTEQGVERQEIERVVEEWTWM